MDIKKIGIAIGFLLVVLFVGYAIFATFFGPSEGPDVVEPTPDDVITGGGLTPSDVGTPPGTDVDDVEPPIISTASPIANGGVTQVSTIAAVPTLGATLSSSGVLSYYNRTDGRFYRRNEDGRLVQMGTKQFPNVQDATFNPAGNSAILEFPDGSNVFYDFQTNRQATLPKHWEEFEFQNDGSKITAKSIGVDASNQFLVVSNPDGSGSRAVQELGVNADKVTVANSPTGQTVALAETGRSLGPTTKEVYLIGQNGENLRSMVIEGLNFQPQWSPDGKQLLYSTASSNNDYKPTLWIVDAYGDDIGRNRKSLTVDTWAEKCTFESTSTIYCAVPTELPRGAGLQPGLYSDVPDELYKIDVRTGLQTRIAIPEGEHTIGSVMLSPNQDTLYFTDAQTGVINELKLK